MTDSTASLSVAQDEALGPVDGPCCTPAEDPCVTCLVPEDVAYDPEADRGPDYVAWYRDHEERVWCERMRADAYAVLAEGVIRAGHAATFPQMLADLANAFHDHPESRLSWVGDKLADLYDLARGLDAKSGEMFDDRLAAQNDAREALEAKGMR